MAGEIQILLVHPVDINERWPSIEPLLKTVAQHNDQIDMESTKLFLQSGHAQCWIAQAGELIIGVWITQLLTLLKGNNVRCLMLAGNDAETWLPQGIEALKKWGRLFKCQKIEFLGRPGWERVLKKHDFHKRNMVAMESFI